MAKKKASKDNIFNFIASELNGDVLADAAPVTYFLDTGNLAFNWVLSGRFMGGGIPGGKITEFFGPEASGKCIAEDMEVLLSNGVIKTIKQIVEQKDSTPIMSLNTKTNKFEARKVDQFWSNGEKECWEVKTKTGRRVETTKNHLYLTPDGWEHLEYINEGSLIAVPKKDLFDNQCDSDILWDEVCSISNVGLKQTYDLGIAEYHNFIANDCIVHNSYWGANIARGTQAIGGIPVYLDCENSLNNDFVVKTSHIDLKKIVRFDPSSGVDCLEGVFNKIYTVIKKVRDAGDIRPIVFIYDSIASSPCARALRETEIDTDKCTKEEFKSVVGGKEQPGERAKICSKEFSKLGTLLEKTNSTVLVLNQTRMKIGVLYGCFSYNSKVLLEDGTWMKIGKIVNNKLPAKVMSYNSNTGKVEAKNIVAWHKNGKLRDDENFIKIKFKRRFDNAFGYMMATPNHVVFIKNEKDQIIETNVSNIKLGDTLAAVQPHYLTDEQLQFVYGSVLGDGCLKRKDFNCNVHLELGHGLKQIPYLDFKAAAFEGLHGAKYTRDSDGAAYIATTPLYELERLCSYKSGVGKLKIYQIPQEIIDNLDELGLAIWYMDDGTYGGYHEKYGSGKSTICCFKFKDKHRMIDMFKNRFGLNPSIKDRGFVFDSENTIKLHSIIARFVIPSMAYKIHPKFHYLFDYVHKGSKFEYKTITNTVLKVENCVKGQSHKDYKYDLTIEDNSTYIVGGAIVHNSPEVCAGGGESLKFYASCRVRTSIQKKIENKKLKTSIGINLKVTNKKNRCCSPFREAEGVHLYWNDGVNPLSGLLTCLIQDERIDKVGNGVYIVKEPWANGQEIKFRASKAKNEIEPDVLYNCPALIDASDEQSVRDYFDIFGAAIKQGNNEENEETDASNDESSNDDYGG